eukprot:TRINITY_DN5991_c0_g1_i1.p1 TRINITY_DN5991_c0_g1~~TRINITY_DN5991_c0_g1_i1.p1  ORF type:complete len:317 (+),score=21.22 TRINITY_DN5991_c0_g1_i1:141-953(+)
MYDDVCGGNLKYIYADHPLNDMPIFASGFDAGVSAQSNRSEATNSREGPGRGIKCIAAAKRLMKLVHAEHDQAAVSKYVTNETLIEIVKGTHPNCAHNQPLGNVSIPCLANQAFDYLQAITTEMNCLADKACCMDQDGILPFVREVCLHEEFVNESTFLPFLENIQRCSDIPASKCSSDTQFARSLPIINGYFVPPGWQSFLQRLCPVHCNLCTHGSSGFGKQSSSAGSSPPSTSRLPPRNAAVGSQPTDTQSSSGSRQPTASSGQAGGG